LAQLGWGLSKKGVVVINRPAAANTKFNQIEHNRAMRDTGATPGHEAF